MSNKFSFNVGLESVGTRLDKFLAQEFLKIKPEITRTKIQNFIAQKLVKNSQNLILENDSYKLKINDEILVEVPDVEPSHLKAKEIDFGIVYEDNDLMVINKPSGLTVHPGSGNQENTLVNGLLFSHRDK